MPLEAPDQHDQFALHFTKAVIDSMADVALRERIGRLFPSGRAVADDPMLRCSRCDDR